MDLRFLIKFRVCVHPKNIAASLETSNDSLLHSICEIGQYLSSKSATSAKNLAKMSEIRLQVVKKYHKPMETERAVVTSKHSAIKIPFKLN
jgi:hypothetical protein